MSAEKEMSRYSLLHCVAVEARNMAATGMPISDALRAALDQLDWRDWAHEGDGPVTVEPAS